MLARGPGGDEEFRTERESRVRVRLLPCGLWSPSPGKPADPDPDPSFPRPDFRSLTPGGTTASPGRSELPYLELPAGASTSAPPRDPAAFVPLSQCEGETDTIIEVIRPDGSRRYYGQATSKAAPAAGDATAMWLLSTEVDASGNTIRFDYQHAPPSEEGPRGQITDALAMASHPASLRRLGQRRDRERHRRGRPSRRHRFEYEPHGMYVAQRTDPLGHRWRLDTHEATGWPVGIRDPNGATTRTQYDGFGRVRIRTDAAGVTTETHYRRRTAGGLSIRTERAGAPEETVHLNALGRWVDRRSEGYRDGRTEMVVELQRYDAAGRVTERSEPHYRGDEVRWQRLEYDALGELRRTVGPGEGVERRRWREADRRSVRDAGGSVREITFDPRGHVIETIEDAMGKAAATHTEVCADGRIAAVRWGTHPATTRSTYDSLGRLIRFDDADAGRREHDYNAFGERVRSRDARGWEREFEYDALGRQIREQSVEGETRYVYDEGEYGIGRLWRSVRGGVLSESGYVAPEGSCGERSAWTARR